MKLRSERGSDERAINDHVTSKHGCPTNMYVLTMGAVHKIVGEPPSDHSNDAVPQTKAGSSNTRVKLAREIGQRSSKVSDAREWTGWP